MGMREVRTNERKDGMNKYQLRKHKYFDPGKVKCDIWYTLHCRKKFLWWHYWSEEGYMTEVGKLPYRGDKDWAVRISNNYKIELPS
jgi:hypothetical protein